MGGHVNQAGTTARVGRGEYLVVEADESDRSFLMFAPVVAVVTTIDREHLDQYSSLEDIQGAFLQFVNRVPFYGAAVLCLDEPNVQAIIPDVKRPIITYGTSQPGRSGDQRRGDARPGRGIPPYVQGRGSGNVSFCRIRREFTTYATPRRPRLWRSISMWPAT